MTKSRNLIGRFNLDNPNDQERLQTLRWSIRWYNKVYCTHPEKQRRLVRRAIAPEMFPINLITDTMDKYLCSWGKAVKILKKNYPITHAKVMDVYVYRKVP
jgi:hypothetical protein